LTKRFRSYGSIAEEKERKKEAYFASTEQKKATIEALPKER